MGRACLARWIQEPTVNLQQSLERQSLVQALAAAHDWRADLSVRASLDEEDRDDPTQAWLNERPAQPAGWVLPVAWLWRVVALGMILWGFVIFGQDGAVLFALTMDLFRAVSSYVRGLHLVTPLSLAVRQARWC